MVVAYALAGTVLDDLTRDPLSNGADGKPIHLKDIWPTAEEVESLVAASVSSQQFELEYGRIFKDDETARSLGLTGDESFTISGVTDGIEPRQKATGSATR